jgi:anti-anti-sigma regulatory factor
MDSFEISQHQMEKATVFAIKGYLNAEAGKEVMRVAEEALKAGKIFLIVDFSECPSVNSPGSAALLDVTLKALDDFKGRVILTGLKKSQVNFFSMAGIIPTAEVDDTVEKACQRINQ